MSISMKVSTQTFAQNVLHNGQPVLVDFWAPWYSPCRMMAPVLEQIATKNQGRLKVPKVNVDQNSEVAARYGVMGIPALALFINGKVVGEQVGYVSKVRLQQFVDEALVAR